VIAVIVVLLLLINKLLLAPIERLKIYAKEFLENNNSDTTDELKLNVKEYRQLADYLQELFMQLLRHQEELVVANKKIESDYKVIQNLNNSLEEKVAKKTQELQLQLQQITQKDQLLQEQAKLAAMGEMIDAVAHQWKTPLTSISYYVQNLEFMLEDETLEKKQVQEHLDGIMAKIDHLLDTMDSFREFFRPVSVIEAVSLKKLIDETLLLMHDELLKNQIETEFVGDDMKIFLIPNEFKHILINLINNSKAAFNENDIAKRVIRFEIRKIDNYEAMITIEDTAGGIAKNALGKIFEPHFTTKKDSGGTGIGLYVSKLILDKIGAKVEVYNSDSGACFEIRVYNACGI
ncbi:MAG: sensor histidine kinase, partial [Campylobacterota bacterium]